LIPVLGEDRARYLLLEKEQIPTGRLNAIVLQQYPDGAPGLRLAYQIDCAQGPAWTDTTEADNLAALRELPVGDEFLRAREQADHGQQIAVWICRQPNA
jgi:hypothetical protein